MTFPLAGALLGFLCYNANPATVFLGDSGALLIGFLLGCYGMIWTQKSATLLSMVCRCWRCPSLCSTSRCPSSGVFCATSRSSRADRRHIHHRLLDRGFTARQAVWVLYLFAALAAALALLSSSPWAADIEGFVIGLFCLAALIGVRQLGAIRSSISPASFFRGRVQTGPGWADEARPAELGAGASTDENSWWTALWRARSVWASPKSAGPGQGRAIKRWPAGLASWSFGVWIGERQKSIEVSGAFPDCFGVFDLMGFAETLRRTLPPDCAPQKAGTTVSAAL